MPAKPVRVLVVDDEPAMRRALRASLTASGFQVEEAFDGDLAIALVRRQIVDLVLLDIHMPGMSGMKVCRRIRPLAPQAGIIMITVTDHVDEKVQALEAGADDYVTKPFLLRELIARMRALLRRIITTDHQLAEPVLRAGELELDIRQRTLKKAGNEVQLSPGVRSAFTADAEPGRSAGTRQTPTLHLGAGIRRRAGIPADLCKAASQKDRSQPGNSGIHFDGALDRVPFSSAV